MPGVPETGRTCCASGAPGARGATAARPALLCVGRFRRPVSQDSGSLERRDIADQRGHLALNQRRPAAGGR